MTEFLLQSQQAWPQPAGEAYTSGQNALAAQDHGAAAQAKYANSPLPPLTNQVGGSHYKRYAIQPIEYTVANGLSYLAGNVVKYVTRYKDKGGAEDIRKAIHYLELILEFEYPNT